MGTHIARFEVNGDARWGVVRDGALHSLEAQYETLAALLHDRETAVQSTSTERFAMDEVQFLSPVTAPCSIVSQGLNYATHRAEAGREIDKPPFNLLFMKASSSLSGPHDDVIRPAGVRLLDYELELGLVVGKAIESTVSVTNENLHDYIAGIVITNDVSARDVQIPQQQWFKGKSFRTFCPAGPYLYLIEPDDIPQVLDLDIQLEVNGEVRQRANTSQLLYGPAETLTELSSLMNLYPGDLIQTGTPGGVAIKAPSAGAQRVARILMNEKKMFGAFLKRQLANPNYLKDGDMIRCTMRSADGRINLGEMNTRVVS